jgi:CRISPR-associated endonuclease/helicase Cas3
MHPLLAHGLDVAAVALILPQRRSLELPDSALAFLVALHDVGKISRPFQGKVPALWPSGLFGSWPQSGVPAGPGHDEVGFALLAGPLAAWIEMILPDWFAGERLGVLRSLAGHHGRPPRADSREARALLRRRDVVCEGCLGAAEAFGGSLEALFTPSVAARPADDASVDALIWKLAGLVTLADWIASRQSWFPYADPSTLEHPHVYWEVAQNRAASAVEQAGLLAPPSAAAMPFTTLFPKVARPSPIQEWASTCPLPSGPALAIVEDMTGSGKTEAALMLAHRLIADERAGGVFIALPTMATANAMFSRLAAAYRRLFAETPAPSLSLAHGHAHLDPRFRAAITADPAVPAARAADPADQPGEAQCASWLASEGRRALLATVGVGTIDQALMAVLPVRHAALRLAGLNGKVLVIDEAHAFDSYMRQEMLALLRFHAALGGSAVVLSATLTQELRQSLADSFREGLGKGPQRLASTGYPLATMVGGEGVTETACRPRDGLVRRLGVRRLADTTAAIDAIVVAAKAGGAVAWVRNTVDDAITGAEALRARGVEVLLFHARFAMVDRLRIEAEVMRRFGPNADGADRAMVVVATQVIEQSLDIDFDAMVTDLAPVDLLIQRAGRLWRHAERRRPLPKPELLIISPPPLPEPDAAWLRRVLPGTAAVYRDPALLWRGARALFESGEIVSPGGLRDLIEQVADAAAPGTVPQALAPASAQAEGKASAAAGVARQNVLSFTPPYARDSGLWEPEERTPTRLEGRPQATLRLAWFVGGRVVPYADDSDPRRAWALSEVRVAAYRLEGCTPQPALAGAIATVRAEWPRWERDAPMLHCAVLEPGAHQWHLVWLRGGIEAAIFTYDPKFGLCLPIDASQT